MDVDNVSFYPMLLDILTDISEAHFVAFDLELSGVCSKASWGEGSGKPTLQERYAETKQAAERYQILQIGLTCVRQNIKDGKYTLKPYNFDICPIIRERGLDVERIFSFQSGAAEFLLGAGFDMNKPFRSGVPYLSRGETKIAREKHTKRQDKTAMADIEIKSTEVESLAFLDRVRSEIKAWVESTLKEKPSYINIAPVGHETLVNGARAVEGLSRFEKRLVHQIVRAEFPDLVTVSRKDFIQIVKFDKEREKKLAATRRREMEERIKRQKGFRWIIEALLGSDLTALDLKECAKDPSTGEEIFVNLDQFRSQFNRAQTFLRCNPKILVGHNCFLDMVYIYRHFVGTLPDTVEEFQRKLHEAWPTVVDTKYMSTHKCGDINPVSSLEQIATQLRVQSEPVIDIDPKHSKYENVEAYHEAGYDSFLTAQIAVRLSTKLEREGAYYLDVESRAAELEDLTLTEHEREERRKENKLTRLLDARADKFVPTDIYDDWKYTGEPTMSPPLTEDDYFPMFTDFKKRRFRIVHKTYPGGMPRFDTDFWRVYGNKLRVFGTQEGVCVLDGSAESPNSEEDGGVVL